MNEVLIECKNLSKSFKQTGKDLVVFDDLDLEINKGLTLALVGSSGCGKSTLLHLLAGLDLPDSGNILFQNKKINELSVDERAKLRNCNFGFVYQFHYLLHEFTCIENVAMPLFLGGLDKDYSLLRAKEMLLNIGLEYKLDSLPSELSGGERQRVAIARSMINDPMVLIMDEPTGNLDSKNVRIFMNLVLELVHKKNTTLIIATHDKTVSNRLERVVSLE
tara:strand:- start:5899 stop:6558 length:660 start_codon:yes stop_codon:yes gene_type:complete